MQTKKKDEINGRVSKRVKKSLQVQRTVLKVEIAVGGS